MGAEKHADRPGWGGGCKVGLDPPAIRLGGRRERLLQFPRPRGGQTAPNATILVAIRLAHRHGHALRAHIWRGDSGDSLRPTVSSGGVGDALPREEAKAEEVAQLGRQPRQPTQVGED